MVGRPLPVLRAMLATAGRPVLQRTIALWTAVGVVAAVLFSDNGIRAHDVTLLFHRGVGARLALGTTWIVLATPVVSPAFNAAGTRTLRSLPVRRSAWAASLVALLLFVQAPCGVLFARGDDPLHALVESLCAVAIEAGLVAATRKAASALLPMSAMALVVADAPASLAVLPAAGLSVAAVTVAWRVALDGAARDVRMTRPAPAVLLLTVAHLLRMLRVARAHVTIAAGSAALGALALGVSLLNDPPARPIARAMAVLALPLTGCAAVLVGPVRETEDRVRALARAARTQWTTLLGAFALALVMPSSAMGGTAGAIAGALAHASPLRSCALAGAAAGWAVPIACAVAVWARWHDRRARRSPALFVIGVVVVAALATGVGAAW